MVAVTYFSTNIELRKSWKNRHHHKQIVALLKARTVGSLLIILAYVELLYKIEVHFIGCLHLHAADKHCRIGRRHVDMAHKAERCLVSWIKGKSDMWRIGTRHHCRAVCEIKSIKIGSERRQGTHKGIFQQVYIVVVKVDRTQEVVENSLGIRRINYFVDAIAARTLHYIFCAVVAAAIMAVAALLFQRYKKYGLAVDFRRLDMLGKKWHTAHGG